MTKYIQDSWKWISGWWGKIGGLRKNKAKGDSMSNPRKPFEIQAVGRGYKLWFQTSLDRSLFYDPNPERVKVDNHHAVDYQTLEVKSQEDTDKLLFELKQIITYIEQDRLRQAWLKDIAAHESRSHQHKNQEDIPYKAN